jgi:aryl-alcohol dehydrogenase-like predicted oxidoreductase
MPSAAEQCAIVEACLDGGIRWIDTTYQPERVALGKVLKTLGRRDEATVIAWNFFQEPGPDGSLGGADYYQPEHLKIMLGELATEWIDGLMVHELDDPARNEDQIALALKWQQQGHVRQLGYWGSSPGLEQRFAANNPFQFFVRPHNVRTADSLSAFQTARRLGWQTLACSPFIRGWELDELIGRAVRLLGWPDAEARERLSDYLLRYSLFSEGVDRLIVAMRRAAWVGANVASVRRGPLDPEERAILSHLTADV